MTMLVLTVTPSPFSRIVLLALLLCVGCILAEAATNGAVQVFHLIMPNWGANRTGEYQCEENLRCDWFQADTVSDLATNLNNESHAVKVGVYNIHSLQHRYMRAEPLHRELSVHLSMAESEESFARYTSLLQKGMRNFDGFSGMHPRSTVQRVPDAARFKKKDLFSRAAFADMIKAGVYIASNCHQQNGTRSARDQIVQSMRNHSLRVDGLGACLNNVEPGKVRLLLRKGHPRYQEERRRAHGRYLFSMAFENTLEMGYVTEKAFDALIGGSVPVYFGDAAHLKTLLPDPKAAIFLSDFADLPSLVQYLQHLSTNETAYEEHRAWHKSYDEEVHFQRTPLLAKSWECRVCEWAAQSYSLKMRSRAK